MQTIVEFIKENFNNIFSYIVGIVGVLSAIWTYRSYHSGKEKDKTYDFLLDVAGKNIDRNIKEKDLKDLQNQINKLKEEIRDTIPIEAERVVLKNKLETEINLLNKQYSKINELKEKLLGLPDNHLLSSELENIIQFEIRPEYEESIKREKAKERIIIVTLITLLFFNILPDSLSNIISLVSVIVLIDQFRFLLPNEEKKLKKLIKNFSQKVLIISEGIINALYFICVINAFNRDSTVITAFNCLTLNKELIIILFAGVSLFSFILIEITCLLKKERQKTILIFLSLIIIIVTLALTFVLLENYSVRLVSGGNINIFIIIYCTTFVLLEIIYFIVSFVQNKKHIIK